MCLKLSRFRHPTMKPKKARRNIPCYKVLVMWEDGKLMTPFTDTLVAFDDIDNGLRADFFQTIPEEYGSGVYIENAIHSYKRPPTNHIRNFANSIVVKCYIPKGTLYWCGRGEYASEMIRFNCPDCPVERKQSDS